MTLALGLPEDGPEEGQDEPEAKKLKSDTEITQAQTSDPAEPEKEMPENPTDTWDDGDGGWGATVEGPGIWGKQEPEVIEDNPWFSFTVDKPESLSPGIVECSMRRIVSITRPPPSVTKSPPLADGVSEPNADAIELELDCRFAKVVLTPMIDWDGGESPVYTKPTILVTSRGAVVDSDAPAQSTEVQGGPHPHNPTSDEITLLIDNVANQIDYLREGMAIGGTWVQLARQDESASPKKKKKGKSKKSTSGYWYLDELAIVVPSFWTVAIND